MASQHGSQIPNYNIYEGGKWNGRTFLHKKNAFFNKTSTCELNKPYMCIHAYILYTFY